MKSCRKPGVSGSSSWRAANASKAPWSALVSSRATCAASACQKSPSVTRAGSATALGPSCPRHHFSPFAPNLEPGPLPLLARAKTTGEADVSRLPSAPGVGAPASPRLLAPQPSADTERTSSTAVTARTSLRRRKKTLGLVQIKPTTDHRRMRPECDRRRAGARDPSDTHRRSAHHLGASK